MEAEEAISKYDTIEDNGDGTYTVRLTKPITVGLGDKKREITELTSHVPTVADMKSSDGAEGEVAKSVALVSAIFDVSRGAVERLHTYDYFALSAVVGAALGKRPAATGGS